MPSRMTNGLVRDGNVFVIIDIQDTLLKKCTDWERVTERSVVFSQFCHVVNMPIVMTEQYPRGLGRTNLQVLEAAGVEPIPKTTFNCFGEEAFVKALEEHGPTTLILAGIEAHVCVLQTALDAIDRGYRVHVLADTCTSRAGWMADNAFHRMARSGVVMSNTESAMFEMVGDSADPLFKRMLFLVK
jgi:isochorismate hydrolase